MADPPRLVFTICGSAGTLCNNSSSCSINVVVVVVVVVGFPGVIPMDYCL